MILRLSAAAVPALALALTGCGEPAKPIKQLMAEDVQPTADIYWKSVQWISDETGDHEIYPKTEEEWRRVRQAAVDLQAFGKRLQEPAYTEGRGEDWTQFAQGLVDVAKEAEQAAIAQDRDKVFEVGGTVYSVCSACHQIYPPAADAAVAGGEAG